MESPCRKCRWKKREKKETSKLLITLDERAYITRMDQSLRILSKDMPRTWSEEGFKQIKVLANALIRKMEVFNPLEPSEAQPTE